VRGGEEIELRGLRGHPIGIHDAISVATRVGIERPVEAGVDSAGFEVVGLSVLDHLIASAEGSPPFADDNSTAGLVDGEAEVGVVDVRKIRREIRGSEVRLVVDADRINVRAEHEAGGVLQGNASAAESSRLPPHQWPSVPHPSHPRIWQEGLLSIPSTKMRPFQSG